MAFWRQENGLAIWFRVSFVIEGIIQIPSILYGNSQIQQSGPPILFHRQFGQV